MLFSNDSQNLKNDNTNDKMLTIFFLFFSILLFLCFSIFHMFNIHLHLKKSAKKKRKKFKRKWGIEKNKFFIFFDYRLNLNSIIVVK